MAIWFYVRYLPSTFCQPGFVAARHVASNETWVVHLCIVLDTAKGRNQLKHTKEMMGRGNMPQGSHWFGEHTCQSNGCRRGREHPDMTSCPCQEELPLQERQEHKTRLKRPGWVLCVDMTRKENTERLRLRTKDAQTLRQSRSPERQICCDPQYDSSGDHVATTVPIATGMT